MMPKEREDEIHLGADVFAGVSVPKQLVAELDGIFARVFVAESLAGQIGKSIQEIAVHADVFLGSFGFDYCVEVSGNLMIDFLPPIGLGGSGCFSSLPPRLNGVIGVQCRSAVAPRTVL